MSQKERLATILNTTKYDIDLEFETGQWLLTIYYVMNSKEKEQFGILQTKHWKKSVNLIASCIDTGCITII